MSVAACRARQFLDVAEASSILEPIDLVRSGQTALGDNRRMTLAAESAQVRPGCRPSLNARDRGVY